MAFSAAAIRPAEISDANALAELWLELGRHLVGLNPYAFKVPDTAGLADWFKDILSRPRTEESATFVAEVDGDVAGTVHVRLVPPMEAASRQVLQDVAIIRAEIDALGVAERFRRRGIGRLLMSAAEQWGREKGAGLFFLDTYIASPLSVPFYEHLGYARRSVRFVKPPAYGKRRSVEKVFGRLKTLTGWTGKCSPQILRHTAGNHAAEMGLNEFRIAQYLGHRTLKMVKRYTGTVDVIRNFDAVSPANALGHIPTVKRRQRRPQLEK